MDHPFPQAVAEVKSDSGDAWGRFVNFVNLAFTDRPQDDFGRRRVGRPVPKLRVSACVVARYGCQSRCFCLPGHSHSADSIERAPPKGALSSSQRLTATGSRTAWPSAANADGSSPTPGAKRMG